MTAIEPRRLATNWIEVDLDAIAHNTRALHERSQKKTRLMAVVKGDGYGHGAFEVARACIDAGATWLGVASAWEGAALRNRGFSCPILVLGVTPTPAADFAAAHHLSLATYCPETVAAVGQAARLRGIEIGLHLKVDSGMGRIGLRDEQQVLDLATFIATVPGVRLEGTFTQMAMGEIEDKTTTHNQFANFQRIVSALRDHGFDPGITHVSNSAVTIDLPEFCCDLVRPGLSLYGIHPSPAQKNTIDLKPALQWKTYINQIKDLPENVGVSYNHKYVTSRAMTVAQIPIGYADGYRRQLTNKGQVIVAGHKVPVLGAVCMDQTMIDVTGLDVRPGDEVVLLGRQGSHSITVEDLCEQLNTIPQEIFALIGRRTARFYRKDNAVSSIAPAIISDPGNI